MKKTVIFLFSIFCMFAMHAQRIVWEKKLENTKFNYYESLRSTFDGGYFLITDTLRRIDSVNSKLRYKKDIFLSKFDMNGELEWVRRYRTPYWQSLTDVVALKNNEFILSTYVHPKNSDNDYENLDAALVKLSRNDNVWNKIYCGSKEDQIGSILPTTDGGYIFAGSTNSLNGNIRTGVRAKQDIWLVKLTKKGKIEWERTYGGSCNEGWFVKICRTDDGYVLGTNSKSQDGDLKCESKGESNIWIFKIDNKGQIVWKKNYGENKVEYLADFQRTQDGGYILVGNKVLLDKNSRYKSKENSSGWMLKINSRGEKQWEKSYGGSDHDHFRKVIELSDGSFVAGGVTRSSDGDIVDKTDNSSAFWLMRVDKSGNLLNEKTFGIEGKFCTLKDLQLCKDGGIILGGGYSYGGDFFFECTRWILKVKY